MKTPIVSQLFLLILVLIHTSTNIHSVSSQCLANQKSLLVELRSSLEFIPELSTKLVGWNRSKDCCQWAGVQCNRSNGQVIGLDLSGEAIISGIHNLNPMFRLQHLTRLNLAYNPFLGNVPSALGNLSSLTYLNLSHTGFTGQVPVQFSQLVNLVVLDLSVNKYGDEDVVDFASIRVSSQNLAVIMRNMTQLRELYLGGIVFSAEGNKWGEALSVLPRLQVLSMPHCDLRGGFHPSLAKLRSLSLMDFQNNNLLSAPVPEFLATFTNLTTLRLTICNLMGTFPQKIFQVTSLTTLDLSFNPNLESTLPSSIGRMKRLIMLDLFECNFQGIIPPSLGSLTKLEYLDLSFNNFSGPIPSFSLAKSLKFLELSTNYLSGSIPVSLFPKEAILGYLDLSNNNFEGQIPHTIFQLRNLGVLSLSSNRFNGTLKLHEIFNSLQNLQQLDLSNCGLSIDANGIDAYSTSPILTSLTLASCNINILPEFLKNQPYLSELDLSNNQIHGKIPSWIWNDQLNLLNLSCNSFIDMEQPPSLFPYNLQVLDLHANNIHGRLPAFSSQIALQYLDLSNNSFITSITPKFIGSLSSAQFISLANNNIYGNIPTSLCNASNLQVLDLSHNEFNGPIPACLTAVTQNLIVLNIGGNALHGDIPDQFGENCTLQTLNLNTNFLGGRIPRSIANCSPLEVLDLGNNRLTDAFPCHLKSLSSLKVLVLRSNQLHGTAICPENKAFLPLLQITDLASNRFRGQLSTLFRGRRMMPETNETQSNLSFLQYQANNSYTYYRDEVSVTFKNNEFELQKVLTIFTSIDLSSNAFHGGLPRELGNLSGLKVLNLSRNSISGNIPQSIGNLSQLESLDLSYNAISGSIPQQLASLSFLECLNLSFNNLAGSIPTSTQLQSFDASSYEGNPGLYGPPLTVSGRNKDSPGLVPPTFQGESHSISSRRLLEWLFSGVTVGFPVGIIIFFGPLLCVKRLREWYNYHVDRLLMKMLPDSQRRKRSKKASIKQRPRN